MKIARIEDVSEFVLDGTHGSPVRVEIGVPVLSAQNVKHGFLSYETDRFTSDEEFRAFNSRLSLKEGDLLLTIVGTIGRSAVVTEVRPLVFQRSVAIIRPKKSVLDPRFFFQATQIHDFQSQLVRSSNTSSQAGIYLGKLKEVTIPLPPLAEQRRIAEVLDRAEALRAKRRAALAQLDALTQSLFLDLFGDPLTNPKAWPKVELGEIVKLIGGYAFKSEDFASEGNAVVRISNLTGNGIDLEGVARIPAGKLGKGVGYKIHPGDILIAMSGATTGKLGVVPLELSEDLYLNQRVGNYRIRDEARVQREFLLGLLRSPFYQRFLWQLAAGVAQPNVSGWQLESAVVPLPPIPLQREFARRVTAVESLKTAQRAALAELDALFATLQHRAFRGEL